MRLLLDTQVLLWFAEDSPRLKNAIAEAIEDSANEIMVSTVSLWEVAIKVRVGKLVADVPALAASCVQNGFRLIDVTTKHVARLAALPLVKGHRDPFDHLLLAQAVAEGATFVSADAAASRYGVPVLPA